MDVSIAEAKASFATLVRKAEAGEAVTLTRHGKAVARIVAVPSVADVPLLGGLKGQITLAPDFDDLPDGFATAFTAPIAPE